MFMSALHIIYFMPCPWGRKFLLDLAHLGSHQFLPFFVFMYLLDANAIDKVHFESYLTLQEHPSTSL